MEERNRKGNKEEEENEKKRKSGWNWNGNKEEEEKEKEKEERLQLERECKGGVVDERSEICNQYYVGSRTDVVNNCPKSIGMLTLLRTMAPDIICVDEIGKEEDIKSIFELFNCGVDVVATVHAKDITEIQKKENIKKLILNKCFDNYIVLSKPKCVPTVYNKNFEEIYIC